MVIKDAYKMDRLQIRLSMKRRAPIRVVGDPPCLGRIERMARGVQGGTSRRLRSGKKGSRRRHRQRGGRSGTRAAIILFSLTILAIVASVAIWLYQRGRERVSSQFEMARKAPVVERIESRFESPTEDQSRAIVMEAIGAKDEAAVLANFRLNGVAPAEVLEFLHREEELHGPGRVKSWFGSIDPNNTLVESISVERVKDGKTASSIAMLTPDENGAWKLDFDSFAGKCEPTWKTVVSGEAGEGMVRIWFVEDSYYNGVFVDEAEWLCFSMARLDSDVRLFGYCRRNSPQAAAIASILNRVRTNNKNEMYPFRATLAISRPEGAEKRQFEIKRVLAEDWLLTDKAFDGSPGPVK